MLPSQRVNTVITHFVCNVLQARLSPHTTALSTLPARRRVEHVGLACCATHLPERPMRHTRTSPSRPVPRLRAVPCCFVGVISLSPRATRETQSPSHSPGGYLASSARLLLFRHHSRLTTGPVFRQAHQLVITASPAFVPHSPFDSPAPPFASRTPFNSGFQHVPALAFNLLPALLFACRRNPQHPTVASAHARLTA
ncbi:hypothetical protein TRVL_04980 [Trypanosoma vivax]|nr:hypothetical protein TRVL_04980 [Trypanosoma vivax]